MVVSEEPSCTAFRDLNRVKEDSVGYAKLSQGCSFALLVMWIPAQKTAGMTEVGWLRNGSSERLQAA